MCLAVVYRGKEKKAILSKLSESFWAYKIIKQQDGSGWKTQWGYSRVYAGVNAFRQNSIASYGGNYRGGTHLFRNKLDAYAHQNQYCNPLRFRVIRCYIKKEWINTIGKNDEDDSGLIVVCKKAIFPKYLGEKK